MGRVAIVTGGTRGIGEAISLALRDQGVTVAANFAGNAEKGCPISKVLNAEITLDKTLVQG